MFNGDVASRTLYVGNIDSLVSEQLLLTLFGTLGQCKGCKIIKETGSEIYAFIEFSNHNEAQMALLTMNKRSVLGKELKVNWATQSLNPVKQDTSKHSHIFVGDLTSDIEVPQLKEAFAPFGEISDAKIISDPQTGRSKGFGFVCFVRKEDAELAITGMNGTWLGGRTIRTNWATGKGGNGSNRTQGNFKELNYDDVQNQSGPLNTTVYCGGISSDTSESMMREAFKSFGEIIDVRIFKEKGYAFVRYTLKEAAVRAICGVHGTDINGNMVKCSWGKEPSELQHQQQLQQQQQLGSNQQMKNSIVSNVTTNNSNQQQQGFYPQPPIPGYWSYSGYAQNSTYMSPFSMQGFGSFPSTSSTWSNPPSQNHYTNVNGSSSTSSFPQQPAPPPPPQQQSPFSSSILGSNGSFGSLGQSFTGK